MSQTSVTSIEKRRSNLQVDCENCFGLCCVALAFTASSDFANDKDAGQPCSNLQTDYRCSVHKDLRELGFKGCTVYDCFGAGQKISQVTFEKNDWRKDKDLAKEMFEVFPIMRQLHELLWYLSEALTYREAHSVYHEIHSLYEEIEKHTLLSPKSIIELDMTAIWNKVNVILLKISELVRAEAIRTNHSKTKKKTFGRGVDLIGANLKKADLRGANFRGAYLIAADLSGADLCGADFIGADLRDTNLKGTNLIGSIFLTQAQINAAMGDLNTKLPSSLTRPKHWLN